MEALEKMEIELAFEQEKCREMASRAAEVEKRGDEHVTEAKKNAEGWVAEVSHLIVEAFKSFNEFKT